MSANPPAGSSTPAGFRPTARELAPTGPGESGPAAPSTGARGRGDFRCTCPNCGSALWDKECKSRCPRCHFFTDCSDPW